MAIRFLSAILIGFGFTLSLLAQAAASEPIVQIKYGKVQGTESLSTFVFKGIPYAASPSGPLRWQPPQEPKPWSNTFVADHFSDACPQTDLLDKTELIGNEDCLKLNVWRPKLISKPLPVMVFIHGGANTVGSGADEILGQEMYDGTALSEDGVILVTINYRLGALGFMAHSALAGVDGQVGNYGVLDQIRALQFVHDNIAAFGGDASNVTVFGESAGAINTLILIASPLSKGLFQRAIIESGFLSDVSVAEAEKQGDQFAKASGCGGADAASCLRSLPVEKILVTSAALSATSLSTAAGTIDGVVLKQSVLQTIQSGQHNRVPVIIGSNRDEMRTLAVGLIDFGWVYSDDDYLATLVTQFGATKAQAIHEMYPWWMYGTPRLAVEEVLSDFAVHCPARQLTRALEQYNPATFRYVFTHTGESPLFWALGAGHGLELPYVFGTMTMANTLGERLFSQSMRHYWTSFAKTSNPNSAKSESLLRPTWGLSKNDAYMDLDLLSTMSNGFRTNKCDFWDQLQ